MIFVDTHVHIHDCFDVVKLFNSALTNFKFAGRELAETGKNAAVLMLTEVSNANWFDTLYQKAEKRIQNNKDWTIRHTSEECSLCICHDNSFNIFVIAGSQIQTVENLEILALGINKKFKDGRPIDLLITEVEQAGGIPVIPWGFGKWIGKRGNIVNQLLREKFSKVLCLGDNSGRSALFREPQHFQQARENKIKILPGSDPLPFKMEYRRAGSYGFCFKDTLSYEKPASDLLNKLKSPSFRYFSYGYLETFSRFIKNQILMQFKNRIEKRMRRIS